MAVARVLNFCHFRLFESLHPHSGSQPDGWLLLY